MIARFECEGYDSYMETREDGEYVLYEDHLREIEIMQAGMQAAIDFWRNAFQGLRGKA